MATRGERCSGCGRQLAIPTRAQFIRCGVCQAVTRVRPFDHWGQAYDFKIRPTSGGYINPSNMPRPVNNRPIGRPNYNNGFNNPLRPAQYNEPVPLHPNPYNEQPLCPAQFAEPTPAQYIERQPSPALASPPVHGRKRALLCGVNYRQKSYRLKGSINDVKCMKYLLVERLGFPIDCILMLTDEETNPLTIPTKQNIRSAMRWLVQGCQSGDSLVFHFSGHGSRQRDFNNDEVDGYDETLCPLDYETEGSIIDDEINETIVRPLTHGVKLHAIVDSCHSGTILDLPFVCRMNREGYYRWEDQRFPTACYKGTSGGLAISITACDDHETSSDTTAFLENLSTGALTFSFIQAMENERGITYGRLLNAMRQSIRQAKSGIRLDAAVANIVKKTVFKSDSSQEPQLSSSETFDIYSKQVMV
ncbi:hypothetical protein Ddye_001874 [Dipteronia dyeriana]|uniref:Peptidase C14 caspase domain-containing protein n=1 Tax=Dipteronia dyeriana TaxID=168575 RepID=A0AAD9XPQ6_9ROSI|nr:hypothetical protein Ddye_001874 [Dipteronia dyeriana]